MARNYSNDNAVLHELIEDASRDSGATLLIPDLQRPFVWTPTQVILLIDSVLRGWPFGTLLLWSIKHEEMGVIPHRLFWKVVDRTSESLQERVSGALAPQRFRMMLDGQQRIQSLLLAFGGDEWGFKLNDKDWYEDLQQQRWRGRNPARHWSQGQLFLDLKAFDQEVKAKGDTRKIEFRDVLAWANGKRDGGQSTAEKPREPLERIHDPKNLGRFIRLSRLWNLAKRNTPEREYRDKLKALLADHSVSSELLDNTVSPLAEVMTTLNEAKEAPVAFLELSARRDDDNPEIYNDAIVNIFTRLNAAGRVLTRQEITFAWIKQGWDSARTDGKGAAECFETLREDMAQYKFHVDIDELVRIVSAFWATIYNGGILLKPSDLLRGNKIGPMAQNLVDAWKDLHRDLIDICDLLDCEDLRLSEVYASLNAAIVLTTLWSLLRRWERFHKLNVTDGDSFAKECKSLLRSRADRWLLCSQWADRWGSSNDQSFAQYISDLSKLWQGVEKTDDPRQALNTAAAMFDDWLKKLVPDASDHIQNLAVDQRQFVNAYYGPIWIWLRLDELRWKMAGIPLRAGARQTTFLHVDHIVPVKIWENMAPYAALSDAESGISFPAHAIGNCLLLESSFNISKGMDELETFLNKVHEFRNGEEDVDQWCDELAIPGELRRPGSFSPQAVVEAVNSRTNAIKSELLAYVDGTRSRRDGPPLRIASRNRRSGKKTSTPFRNLSDLLSTEALGFSAIGDPSIRALVPWKD